MCARLDLKAAAQAEGEALSRRTGELDAGLRRARAAAAEAVADKDRCSTRATALKAQVSVCSALVASCTWNRQSATCTFATLGNIELRKTIILLLITRTSC